MPFRTGQRQNAQLAPEAGTQPNDSRERRYMTMFALKWLLMAAGVAMFGTAAGVVGYDVYLAMQFQKLMGSGEPGAAGEVGERRPMFGRIQGGARTPRWSLAMKFFAWAWVALLLALSMVVVPEGSGE